MQNQVVISGIEMTFAHTEIINRIKDIGLPHPVQSRQTVDFRCQFYFLRTVVLKICQYESVQVQIIAELFVFKDTLLLLGFHQFRCILSEAKCVK